MNKMEEYWTRTATPEDLELICRHRVNMFREAGAAPEEILDTMAAHFSEWLHPKLRNGAYLGWIVEHDGAPVAGAGMIVLDWPPHPGHPADSRRGYVLNVWVEPEHRSRGLATGLMKTAQEEARRLGIFFMTLHATAAGRPVYEKLGWKPMPEMSLTLTGK